MREVAEEREQPRALRDLWQLIGPEARDSPSGLRLLEAIDARLELAENDARVILRMRAGRVVGRGFGHRLGKIALPGAGPAIRELGRKARQFGGALVLFFAVPCAVMRKLLIGLSFAVVALGCSASEPSPAAPDSTSSSKAGEAEAEGPITITVSPTKLAHGSGPIKAKLSRAIPQKKGKQYRISLSTPDAKTYFGPAQFLEPGVTEHELRPVEPGTFDVRLLESDGPECSPGKTGGGSCAENEHIIAKSEQITVTPKPE